VDALKRVPSPGADGITDASSLTPQTVPPPADGPPLQRIFRPPYGRGDPAVWPQPGDMAGGSTPAQQVAAALTTSAVNDGGAADYLARTAKRKTLAQAYVSAAPSMDPNTITKKDDERYLRAVAAANDLDPTDLPSWVVKPLSAGQAARNAAQGDAMNADAAAEGTAAATSVVKYIPVAGQILSVGFGALGSWTSGGGYTPEELIALNKRALALQAITTIPDKLSPPSVLAAAWRETAGLPTIVGADREGQTVEK
jgi:hypothetical protein